MLLIIASFMLILEIDLDKLEIIHYRESSVRF